MYAADEQRAADQGPGVDVLVSYSVALVPVAVVVPVAIVVPVAFVVDVGVDVGDTVVHMRMRVHPLVADPAQHVDAEQHEHDPDGGLEQIGDRRRDRDADDDERRAEGEQRGGVADAPRAGDAHRLAHARGPGRERGDGGDVVDVERVLEAEQEAESQERGEHRASLAGVQARAQRVSSSRSQSHQGSTPSPRVAESWKTRSPGLIRCACSRKRSTSNDTYGSRSTLFRTRTFPARNMCGYLSGLSSPSVTDTTTTRTRSPRSNSAGQTRLPTFSMIRIERGCGARRRSPSASMSASRWQPAPVLIWNAAAPAAWIRSASRSVA